MLSILVIGSLRSPPKGENAEMVREVYDSLFFSSDPSFPLEGKSREAGKGVRGRAPIGCSFAVLTANRRPVSFLLLTIGHAFGVKVQKAQRGRFLRWTGPIGRRVLKFDGLSGRGVWWRLRRKFYNAAFGGHVHIEYHNQDYHRPPLRHFVALFP